METRKNYNRLRRAMWRLTALLALCVVLLAFWRYSPVGSWSQPDRLIALFDALDSTAWAGPIVVAAFLVGSLVVFPVTALIAATGIALGPTAGLVWASVGSMTAAMVGYGLVRVLPERVVDAWGGPWVRRLGGRFENGGIVSVMLARNLPVAPFTLINYVSAAAGIRFFDYVVGTILGMAPMIAALTVLGDRLRGVWEAPSLQNVLLLCGAVVVWVVIAVGLQSLSNRWVSAR